VQQLTLPTETERLVSRQQILGMNVDCTSYEQAVETIRGWAGQGLSKYVCAACVNNAMEAHDSDQFRGVMNDADLVTPDGMPLVWSLRCLGLPQASRVYGPDLTLRLLAMAEANGLAVGFYGGESRTLARLLQMVGDGFPALAVAYSCSPPFRPLMPQEARQVVEEINASQTSILFVGLGSPKQDYWMAANRGQVRAVMIGVGAAFDFLAGTKRQAPRWMMKIGTEWLFRLASEPRRLWKRYLKQNPRFVVLFALQLLGWKTFSRSSLSQS
jgi:N-acetylglucosaminyldiphosphoundecaprenol N-acetyl-beta-D-mannosaminyltransferase